MMLRVESDLLEVVLYLDQVSIVSHEQREKEQDQSVADPAAAVRYREKELQSHEMDRQIRVETVEDAEVKID